MHLFVSLGFDYFYVCVFLSVIDYCSFKKEVIVLFLCSLCLPGPILLLYNIVYTISSLVSLIFFIIIIIIISSSIKVKLTTIVTIVIITTMMIIISLLHLDAAVRTLPPDSADAAVEPGSDRQ